MISFRIWLFIVAATISVRQSIRSQSGKRTSDEDEDGSENTFADAAQSLSQIEVIYEPKEASVPAPSHCKSAAVGQGGIGEQQLGQILRYLKCAVGETFKPKQIWFAGKEVMDEKGLDMEPYFQALLEAAQGWQQSLLCVKDLNGRQFCYYIPKAWNVYTSGESYDTEAVTINSGMFVFYWNDCCELQVAKQRFNSPVDLYFDYGYGLLIYAEDGFSLWIEDERVNDYDEQYLSYYDWEFTPPCDYYDYPNNYDTDFYLAGRVDEDYLLTESLQLIGLC